MKKKPKTQEKKFPRFNKHLRHYLAITIGLNLIVAVAYFLILISEQGVTLGPIEITTRTSVLIVFVSVLMIVMGCYYWKALKSITK
jgi:uncharacterized membrane protein YidH (DUF202 family)